MKKRKIWVQPSCFVAEFEMIIPIPEGCDESEAIDDLFDVILNEDIRNNVEWGFCDEDNDGDDDKNV